MFRKFTTALILFCISSTLYAQDIKKDSETTKTKMDIFASKTGTIIKLTDTNLPSLKTVYGGILETRVRKIGNGSSSAFFYQIVKEGKYSNTAASIEYNDLVEVLKALKALKSEIDKDITSNPDYLENKFVTVDGFQVGYYVSKGKTSWYLKLEKYGSDNTFSIDSVDSIETAFVNAKNIIDELKK